jgi:diguanylate cyclase (GGDEF)-like protein
MRVNILETVDLSVRNILADLADLVAVRELFVASVTATTFTFAYRSQDGAVQAVDGPELLLRHTFCQLVYNTRQIVQINDTSRHPYRIEVGPDAAAAYLGVPIHYQDGRLFGTLCAVHDAPHDFTDRERQSLALAARALGCLFDMEEAALRDPLTGVLGRSFLSFAWGRGAYRIRERWGLILLDMDALKGINDAFGHDVGDRLIQAIADRLVQLRIGPVARLGGDEFVVVFPDLPDPRLLWAAVERLNQCWMSPIDLPGAGLISVSASYGMAAAPMCGITLDAVLKAADRALYAAKAAGGGRAVAAFDLT